MIRVIGIKGDIDSGKSTVAEGLAALRGVAVIPLADCLKSSIDDMSGQSRWLHKVLSSVPHGMRNGWQLLGNECRYDVGEKYAWVTIALMKIRFLNHYIRQFDGSKALNNFAVPDIRHPEEVERFREVVEGKWGGQYRTWEVRRPIIKPAGATHSSERQHQGIPADLLLHNTGSVQSLVLNACHFYDRWLEG